MLRTREDLSDIENVKDVKHELGRAAGDQAKLAAWAERWGAALCERVEDMSGVDEDDLHPGADDEIAQAEKRAEAVSQAARKALERFDEIITEETVPAPTYTKFERAAHELEAAL